VSLELSQMRRGQDQGGTALNLREYQDISAALA